MSINKTILLAGLLAAAIFISGCMITTPTLDQMAAPFCNQENVDAVYVCPEHMQIRVVSSLAGAGSTYYTMDASGTLSAGVLCPLVAPDAMSDECRELFEADCTEREIC